MSEKPDPAVDAALDVLLARFPGRFGAAEVEQLRAQLRDLAEVTERLRAYPLANGDEPEPIFHAVRPEG